MSTPIPTALRCIWLILATSLPTLAVAKPAAPHATTLHAAARTTSTTPQAAGKPHAATSSTVAAKTTGKPHAATSSTVAAKTTGKPHAATSSTVAAKTAGKPHAATSSTVAAKTAGKPHAATSSTVASKTAGKPHAATSSTVAALLHAKEWWYHPHKDHTPSGAPEDVAFQKYHGYYLGDTKGKVVYLTFDEGSEAGYTKKILDTLKENKVHATFFVTRFYMKEAPDLVKRMLAEGHTVGNHSATHPDLSRKNDNQVKDEILLSAQYFKQLTGKDMPQLFRPPMGECDERILRLTDSLGWHSIFWSMAYVDYVTTKQKGSKYAVDYVMKYYHPGAIILLHPFSSNAQALGEIIKDLRAQGYQFGNLMDMKG